MNVVISGAGVSGLATAISLRRSGHKVTIYERSSLNNEIGAAINVPPNVSRFLIPWGLDPLRYKFVNSQGIYFLSPTTLEEFTSVDYSHADEIFGAPLYYAHRVDLHESLKHMATNPDGVGIPVTIHLRSGVASYGAEGTSMTLLDGTIITADLIVAADGVHSKAIETIVGKSTAPIPATDSNCCYRFLIPRTDLEEDPETRFFNEGYLQHGCSVYSDPAARRRLVTYTCRNLEVHNFVAICYNNAVNTKREDWSTTGNDTFKAEVLEKFAGFNPKLMAVMKKATDVKRWPLLYRPPIRTWFKNRLVVVGDAAHPMLPHNGQGGAQGIEDGLALGLVLNGVTKVSQIGTRLEMYEKIRRNRASIVQILSNVGSDQDVPEEIIEFMEGNPLPKTVREKAVLCYAPDTVKSVVKHMTEFEPTFKIPEGFFPASQVANPLVKAV